MGRHRVHDEPRISTGMRLPESLHKRLVEAAEERELAVNFLVTRAVEEFLDRLIPLDEMVWTRPRPSDRKQ